MAYRVIWVIILGSRDCRALDRLRDSSARNRPRPQTMPRSGAHPAARDFSGANGLMSVSGRAVAMPIHVEGKIRLVYCDSHRPALLGASDPLPKGCPINRGRHSDTFSSGVVSRGNLGHAGTACRGYRTLAVTQMPRGPPPLSSLPANPATGRAPFASLSPTSSMVGLIWCWLRRGSGAAWNVPLTG
jgi:hypothetical protein